jgi:hypothetical protein
LILHAIPQAFLNRCSTQGISKAVLPDQSRVFNQRTFNIIFILYSRRDKKSCK